MSDENQGKGSVFLGQKSGGKGSVFVGWNKSSSSAESTTNAETKEGEEESTTAKQESNQQSSSGAALKNSVFLGPGSGGSSKGSVFVGFGKSGGAGSVKSGQSSYETEPAQSSQPESGSTPMESPPKSPPPEPSDTEKSAFVTKDSSGASAPALKNSVFVNLGPQSSTAVAGESVQVPLKNVSSDPGTVGRVKSVRTQKPQAVVTVKTPSEQSEQSNMTQVSLSEWASSRMEESKRLVSDMSAINEHEVVYKSVVDIYMWVAACLAADFASCLMGTYVLQYIIGRSFGIMLSIIALPAGTMYLFNHEDMTKEERKLKLLYATALYGLFIGLIAKDTFTTFHAPAPFVVALSMAFCAWFMNYEYTKRSRELVLAMSIGPGMFVYFMYAVLTKCMDLIYLIWMIVVGAVAVADLQMKLGTVHHSRDFILYEQIQSIVAFVTTDLLLTVMFASPDKKQN